MSRAHGAVLSATVSLTPSWLLTWPYFSTPKTTAPSSAPKPTAPSVNFYRPLPFFPEVSSILSPSSWLVSPLPLAEPSESRNWILETPIGTAYLQEQGILYPLLYFHASIWYTIGALLKSLFVIWRTTL
ncbi:hypothetical protein PVAP13_1KG248105 [Panicum virgatum]|uniref:Uncharacterized protein n=1 Tax=Panicum virgatum TaxID=38727 RepID=A0A8T0X9R9_PANVG|nr:hypothetical protein PVAP13_1KG248105 [Panicum virgatum]